MPRPDLSTVPKFYHSYINQVKEEEVSNAIGANAQPVIEFLRSIPGDKWSYRYAEGKWSIKEMVQRLNRMNVPLQEETVTAIANCKSPGRPHVARALIQINVCKSLDEAFERFLKK